MQKIADMPRRQPQRSRGMSLGLAAALAVGLLSVPVVAHQAQAGEMGGGMSSSQGMPMSMQGMAPGAGQGMALGAGQGMPQGGGGEHFAFGAPAQAAKADRTVRITIKGMSFQPSSIKVKQGETIRFVVVNKGDQDHDFTIGDRKTEIAHRKEMAEMAETGQMMHHGGDPNAVSVPAGKTVEMVWTFSQAGHFEYDCNVPGHYEAGMKGRVSVGP